MYRNPEEFAPLTGAFGSPDIPELPAGSDRRSWARKLGLYASRDIVDRFEAGAASKGPINVVDLFSGCGGMSTGFQHIASLVTSFRLAAAVDLDPHCVRTYARNLPIEPLQADIAAETADGTRLGRLVDRLDLPAGPLVLIGGPPCQGFSAHAKKNRRSDDSRNNLVRSFALIAERLQPDFILLENVPELTSQRFWHYFSEMKEILEASGYVIKAQVHNLATFGVPQERFRALVMASKRNFSLPTALFGPSSFKTVRDAIGHLPEVRPGDPPKGDPMHYCTRHRASTIETIKAIPPNGGSRPAGIGPACLDKVDGFRDVYGRLYWDRPANTITAYARNPASGRYVHPEQHRGLTIREAALLQGFPASFTFEGPFDDRFRQIGNAVPPVFAAGLAAHVLGEILSDSPPAAAGGESDALKPASNSFSSGIAGRKKGGRNER